mmetsp:Transcript_16985/g.40675  ORF Transcript_16985/g.40675 Transcript_16985/m.40675 type:complete len:254 (-) Transcript_16985:1639-2400(-)
MRVVMVAPTVGVRRRAPAAAAPCAAAVVLLIPPPPTLDASVQHREEVPLRGWIAQRELRGGDEVTSVGSLERRARRGGGVVLLLLRERQFEAPANRIAIRGRVVPRRRRGRGHIVAAASLERELGHVEEQAGHVEPVVAVGLFRGIRGRGDGIVVPLVLVIVCDLPRAKPPFADGLPQLDAGKDLDVSRLPSLPVDVAAALVAALLLLPASLLPGIVVGHGQLQHAAVPPGILLQLHEVLQGKRVNPLPLPRR